MGYMGIDRGWVDTRTPAQKAAADNITIGYMAISDIPVFLCSECEQTGGTPFMIEHKPDCKTGMVLNDSHGGTP